jgi:hypothetical protein
MIAFSNSNLPPELIIVSVIQPFPSTLRHPPLNTIVETAMLPLSLTSKRAGKPPTNVDIAVPPLFIET